ncbi:MAG: zinc-binding dehydrogenase [Nocardioidaceae bacterium]
MPDDSLVPGLLTLSDVMGTGQHAAVSANVGEGKTVVVVGDGAVGLSAVLAAHRLGAERVVAMSRHIPRQAAAREFGATDVVAERGEEGVARIKELFGGIGADCVLECVGTAESMQQAIDSTRPGGRVGYVGAPVGSELPIRKLFGANITVGGGVAPSAATSRRCWAMSWMAASTRARCSTVRCRSKTPLRPTEPWTSGRRSRCCSVPRRAPASPAWI